MEKNNRKKLLYIMLATYLVILLLLLILIFPALSDAIWDDVFRYMSVETLFIGFVTIISGIAALLSIMIGFYSKNSKEIEKETKINIELDNERSYLERKIAELNEKLVLTDERWKEVHHLVMTSQNKQIDGKGMISTKRFLEGFGVDVDEIKIQKDLAFVLTPFHSDFTHTYMIINETCRRAKMCAIKGDEEYVAKDVLQHIIKSIVKSRVVIANLNGRNPNVFYELGIAHTLNKPTILIAHVNTEVPFDLQNQYLVLYKNDEELEERLFDILLKVMTSEE